MPERDNDLTLCCTGHGRRCGRSTPCCDDCTELDHPDHRDGRRCAEPPNLAELDHLGPILVGDWDRPRPRDPYWW